MLIAMLAALAVGAPETPAQPPPPSHRLSARELVRMQFEHRAKSVPPQTGAEATVIEGAYLKSIGHPVQPAADTAGQADGAAGGYGAK